jgi:hypothetical protein
LAAKHFSEPARCVADPLDAGEILREAVEEGEDVNVRNDANAAQRHVEGG